MKARRQAISSPPAAPLPRGFALVVTLSLMILLTVIAVGMLGLASISLRTSAQAEAMQTARSNARMALMLAIGDLQRTMGPDTRVSANAQIRGKSGTTVKPELAQVAGAWESWRPDPTSVGDYNAKKSDPASKDPIKEGPDKLPQPLGGFHQWLVSTADPAQAEDVTYTEKGAQKNAVELVKSPGPSLIGVQVEKIPLAGQTTTGKSERIQGSLAWAVFDEGQKMSASLGKPSTTGNQLERLANQDNPAWKNVSEWSKLADIAKEDRDKLISYQTTELKQVGNTDTGRFSYDMTTYSAGLIADVTLGKFRTDLSLLFKDDKLPADYESRYIYSGTTTPVAKAPDRGTHPYAWPSPDPKWDLLHKFYRIPETYGFNNSGSDASMTIDFNKIPDRLTTSSTPTANPEYNDFPKIAPVISKAQFIFSLSFCRQGKPKNKQANIWYRTGGTEISREDKAKGTKSPYYGECFLVIDPVITLWNPYDVPIKVPEFWVYLYRLPIEFKFEIDPPNPAFSYIDGLAANGGFSQYVDMVAPVNNAPELAYPLRIKPVNGNYIEMYPGEHVVCSVREGTWSAAIVAGDEAVKPTGDEITTQPGWDKNAGGIFSVNLLRDTAGLAGGRLQVTHNPAGTMNLATIPMRLDDNVIVTVQPLEPGVNRGNFKTLGGQSMDFYLRMGKYDGDLDGKGGEHWEKPDFGAMELDYGMDIAKYIKTFSSQPTGSQGTLPVYPIDTNDIAECETDANGGPNASVGGVKNIVRRKKPFLVATLHLKSLTRSDEYRSQFPSKGWVFNNPTCIYSSNGLGNQTEKPASHQYDFSMQELQGSWNNGDVPEVITGPTGHYNGYGGPSVSKDGRAFAPFISIPRVHATSLAQLRHAPLNQSGKLPLQTQILGNSFAHPLMVASEVVNSGTGYLDHSFLANNLFDRTFMSSAKSGDEIAALTSNGPPLINSRMIAYGTPDKALLSGADGYNYSAASLMINGAFNVNSTSVKAWQAFLTAMNVESIPTLPSFDKTSVGTVANSNHDAFTSRYTMPLDEELGSALDPNTQTPEVPWSGYRKLESSQIETIAKALVEDIKKRGPFQSLSEFINRRAEVGELGQTGTLQSAIELSKINEFTMGQYAVTLTGNDKGTEDYQNREAAKGSTLTGTPGYLLQADLLNSMAPYLAVRSDTFKIRAYGEATDPTGKTVIARAWCEAVVQRVPDYVDASTNAVTDHLGSDSKTALSKVNLAFGRRFQIVSFRWLNPQEV